MKIGVSSYSYARWMRETGASLLDVCRHAAKTGFDAIEFTTLGGDDRIAMARELRALCEELGLDVAAYTVGADLASGDGKSAVEALCREIDIAKALGAPILRHDVCFSLPEGMTWESAIEVMVPRIREVTSYAREQGIRTSTENHGFIFQDSARVRALIEAVGDSNYGWLVDLGNFLCVDEPPEEAVRVAASYAIHVHAKDFYQYTDPSTYPAASLATRGDRRLVGTVVGRGVVPLPSCLATLREAGYSGTLSLEFEGTEDVMEAIAEGYRYLRVLTE
ncbi:MAG: sugar phosphate isomerase/epimerase [Clostridia bacterium]|nr:sugar phosphate isomerase/epimerase [Clostridia bacterium]